MKRIRKILSYILVASIIVSVFPINGVLAAEEIGVVVDLSSFDSSNTSGSGGSTLLLTTGNATTDAGALRLTPNSATQVGTVVRRNQLLLTDGFSTYFQFAIDQPSHPDWAGRDIHADGLSFFVYKNDTAQTGTSGEGLGYSGIDNSIAVEFDTYYNDGKHDPRDGTDCHVAIMQDGNADHTGRPAGSCANYSSMTGNTINVWVDYDGTTVTTTYGTSSDRASSSNYTITCDVGSELVGSNVFVGFSASTGSFWSRHRILKWYFKDAHVEEGLDPAGGYVQGASTVGVTLDAATNPGSATVKLYDASGTVMGGTADIYLDDTLVVNDAAIPTSGYVYALPTGLGNGSHKVRAAASGGASNYAAFTVDLPDPPDITLGGSMLTGGIYYYPSANVSGDNIKTILVSFSESVTDGDEIILPASPTGFVVSTSSESNKYVKRINLADGVTASDVQDYIRDIGFTAASITQTVDITITTQSITHDTFFNIDTEHYYQYISDTSTSWTAAYDAAKAMSYMGRTGYLATIMNQDEDEYVNSLSGGKTGWLGGTLLANTGSTEDELYYDGFDTGSVVSTGWYWACGPEKGDTFYNTNSLYPNATSSNASTVDAVNTTTYYNWARGTVSYEPNNQTGTLDSANLDYEACLTTLEISGNTGKHGTSFSWNDKHYTCAGTGTWDAKGYFVEYGDLELGDSGSSSVSTAYASDSGTINRPSGDITLTTVTWTGATAYTCDVVLPGTSQFVTVSVDSGYFTVPSLGSELTFRGGTEGTGYIAAYSAATHYDSAVFSFTNVSAAQALLSDIIYSPDGATPQTITATSSTVAPVGSDIFFEGHYYRYVDSGSKSIDWPSAVLAAGATADPYFGGRGYIATATTQAENSILLRLVENGAGGSDHWDDAWMGGLWQRNTGTLVSPTIVRGTDGNEMTFSDLKTVGDNKTLLKDYTKDFSFGFVSTNSATYICNNYDTVRYYWIDGPEAGDELPNNTADFAPWHATGGIQDEPNCGDFIYIGWQGAYWDDLSAYPGDSGTSFDKQTGYILEFSGYDGGTVAGVIKEDTKTSSAYMATVNIKVEGTADAAPGTVTLRQSGSTVATPVSSGIGVYQAAVHSGTYDVFIGSEDTKTDITINNADNSATVNYYTVSFSVIDASTASGSTISATADGVAISSGTKVLAGKTIVITASGAGAAVYTYAWSGVGTSGETTAALTIASLSDTVDADCTVRGTTLATVTFDAEGGSVTPASQIKLYGSTYGKSSDGTTDEVLPTPMKTGHTFGGWWTGDNGTGSKVIDTTMVTNSSNHTLYAKWTTNNYTISLDAEGGSVTPASQNKLYGSTYGKAADGTTVEALPTPTKTGHAFGGWWTGDNGTGSKVTDSTVVTNASNHTLYAKWTANTYTITFNTNGGSVVNAVPQAYGTAISSSPSSTKANYTFSGWYGDAALTTPVTFPYTVTKDATLYAKWTMETYSVTFMNEDLVYTVTSANSGSKIAAPSDPARSGYTFEGWYKESNCINRWDFDNDSITTNAYLYAKWTINTYTVRFKDWDGTILKTQKVPYGKAAAAPGNPVRTGYMFSGWNKSYGNITDDTTVTALYTVNTCTVTFNTDGGSSVNSQKITYGNSANRPANPNKQGYTFDGWYKDTAFGSAYDFAAAVTANLTLYAKWIQDGSTALTAKDMVSQTAKALTMETAFRFASGDTWECVTSDFVILRAGESDIKVIWSSSDDSVIKIGGGETAKGIVSRPEGKDVSIVITATISKDDVTVSKTFLLIVKRQGASKTETRVTTNRTAAVQIGDTSNSETICRTTLNDGKNIDYVAVTANTIQALIEKGHSADQIAVLIDNDASSPADEFAFEVSADSVEALAANALGLTLTSPEGSISLSNDTVKQAGDIGMGLYFHIVPVPEESEEAKTAFLGSGAVFSVNAQGTVFGTPKTIQTNMESCEATVILPLEGLSEAQLTDEEFLKTLSVFVEHDDGTTELIYGSLVYTDNIPTGIQFKISKFSRFQVVSVKTQTSQWMLIICIAGGVLLILLILLLAVVRRRRSHQNNIV